MRGFTLIELLVVVLIIGILSAVSLPQYEITVMKSRMAAAVPIAKSIKDNMTMFHLTNGKYPSSSEFPDILDFGDKNCSNGVCRIGNYLVVYSPVQSSPLVAVLYSPGTGMTAASQTERFGAGCFANSSATNNILTMACVAGGTKSVQLCKSYSPTSGHSWGGSAAGSVSFYKM